MFRKQEKLAQVHNLACYKDAYQFFRQNQAPYSNIVCKVLLGEIL